MACLLRACVYRFCTLSLFLILFNTKKRNTSEDQMSRTLIQVASYLDVSLPLAYHSTFTPYCGLRTSWFRKCFYYGREYERGRAKKKCDTQIRIRLHSSLICMFILFIGVDESEEGGREGEGFVGSNQGVCEGKIERTGMY